MYTYIIKLHTVSFISSFLYKDCYICENFLLEYKEICLLLLEEK